MDVFHVVYKVICTPPPISLVLPLTDVDKFNYLRSYLESTAIAGLQLRSANYAEAVDTLKKSIVNKHMDGQLRLPVVTSSRDLRGLRHDLMSVS